MHLAQRVVTILCLRASVIEVLALQVDLCPTGVLGQPRGKIQRRGTSDVMLPQIIQLGLKRGIRTSAVIFDRQIVERPGERFRYVPAAVIAETAFRVGYVAAGWHEWQLRELIWATVQAARARSDELASANALKEPRGDRKTETGPSPGLKAVCRRGQGIARVARPIASLVTLGAARDFF